MKGFLVAVLVIMLLPAEALFYFTDIIPADKPGMELVKQFVNICTIIVVLLILIPKRAVNGRILMYLLVGVACAYSFFFLLRPSVAPDSSREGHGVSDEFEYYISPEEMQSVVGMKIEDAEKVLGACSWTVGEDKFIFKHVTVAKNGFRTKGVELTTDDYGTVLSADFVNGAERSSNWFMRLPYFDRLATTNWFNTGTVYKSQSFWSLCLSLIMFGAGLFGLLRFSNSLLVIYCGANHENKLIGKSATFFGIPLLIICYVTVLPYLNLNHSWWMIAILLYLVVVVNVFVWASLGLHASLGVCPQCNKLGCYYPKVQNLRVERTGNFKFDAGKRVHSMSTAESFRVKKLVEFRQWYKKNGICSACGYSDGKEYWTTSMVEVLDDCPRCGAKLHRDPNHVTLLGKSRATREREDMEMDLTRAEHLGGDRFRGEATVHQSTRTTTAVNIKVHESCPSCGWEFRGDYDRIWDNVSSHDTVATRTGELK